MIEMIEHGITHEIEPDPWMAVHRSITEVRIWPETWKHLAPATQTEFSGFTLEGPTPSLLDSCSPTPTVLLK